MARRVFAAAKMLTAVSPYLVEEVSKYVNMPITVVPNPHPKSLDTNTETSDNALSRRAAPKLAMILNGWGKRKNATAGLAAFALVRRAIAGATLHLYGQDFGQGQTAQRWAQGRGIEDGIIFHGMVTNRELMRQLHDCDALLHPALEEACPMSLVEAMSLGIPVVGGDRSGGVPWVLDYGNAGVLTDVRDPVTMSRDILGLFNDPARYRRISQAAHQRAHVEFSAASVAERYLAVYRQAIVNGTSGHNT
jgi:glycosyltransferase involved in cell wall biosynthesis